MKKDSMQKRLDLIQTAIEYHCMTESTDDWAQIELTGFLEFIYNVTNFNFSNESLDKELKQIKQTIEFNDKEAIKVSELIIKGE